MDSYGFRVYVCIYKIAIAIVFEEGSSLAVCHGSRVKFTNGTEFRSSSTMA